MAPDGIPSQRFFEEKSFEQLAALEAGHFWFEERNRLLEWCVRRFFPHATTLCEVGCGTGFVLSYLEEGFPNMRLVAAEYFSEGIRIAQSRTKNSWLIRADARALPFLRDAFDIVGAFDVIEHIDEDELVLEQLGHCLKRRGGLILTVPQHKFLWSHTDEIAHHKRRYSRFDLLRKVKRAGFDVLRCSSFVTGLLPLMLVSRWRGRSRPSTESSDREFRLPPLLNRSFRFVLAMERGLIRGGVSLPFGGSLLLVARKA